MHLRSYRNIIFSVALILTVLATIPALSLIVPLPFRGEPFTELWILGSEHMADDYPFNVTSNQNYTIYVGVRNQMHCSSYYAVYVKFRNESDPTPNSTSATPSPLPALHEYIIVLQHQESWESLLTFSFADVSFVDDRSVVKTLVLDNFEYDVEKSTAWNQQNKGFYYQLIIELWMYSVDAKDLHFHNRFVTLWLNMTI